MELKHVGDLPRVSSRGVTFDHTHPDKYNYLHAALELLNALSYGATESTQHLYKTKEENLSDRELLSYVKLYVKNIDAVFASRETKTQEMIDDLVLRVHENDSLNEEEKESWLNNIHMMRDYYSQYVTNSAAYCAALEALADEIHTGMIQEVSVPMIKNYGIVLGDLKGVLEVHTPPIDSTMDIYTTEYGLLATMHFIHK